MICERAHPSSGDFSNVQTFCVVELGLPLVPIGENIDRHLPQVILSLIDVSNPTRRRKNPFKFGAPVIKKGRNKDKVLVNSTEQQILKTLQSIPGLGEKKAKTLLQKFGSIYNIADQNAKALAKVVGVSTATSVCEFFEFKALAS